MTETKQAIIADLISQMREEVWLSLEWYDTAAKMTGLHLTDFIMLGLIYERDSVTVSQLAAHARRSSGATSIAVNRLEKAGFVRRDVDTNDGRKTIVHAVSLPPQLQEAHTSVRQELFKLLTPYNIKELQLIRSSRADSIRLLKQQISTIRRPSASS